jgi:hypothetical protein
MKKPAVAKGGYASKSSYLHHDSTSANQTQGSWTAKTICHHLLFLEQDKKCPSRCALQYGGQSIHWTSKSSVINGWTVDIFVIASDMIDWTELDSDG